jgi:SAM-dependent methyltransferase
LKYYEGHEGVYKRLKADGHESWDKRVYEQFYMRPFLEHVVKLLGIEGHPKALELGCGTGPISCFLSARGYDVTGIDVSPTAIDMAREQAAKRGVEHVEFKVCDWLTLPLEPKYELIVDGHCLHCVVHDHERAAALKVVHSLLKPGGKFALETMCWSPVDTYPGNVLYEPDGILWTKVPPTYPAETKQIGEHFYVPNRRILKAELIEQELVSSGFRVVFKCIEEPEEAGHSRLFQAVCAHAH